MRIEIPTEGIEQLIASLGFDDAKNVLTGRTVSMVMDSIETEMQRYAERREARQKNRIVGSPASANNLQRPSVPPPQPGLNYFAPQKNLQEMLKADWFEKVSVDKKMYTCSWRETFVAELMKSEHADYIARKWADHKQILMIKGHVVGALKNAGVLKGSDLEIARAYLGKEGKDLSKEVKTFAKYIGESRREPYFDWVEECVGPIEKT